jgi:hypothetical protein
VTASFTKFDPRAFLQRNWNPTSTAGTPTLAALAGLAGCEAHSEKREKQGLSTNGLPGTNALPDCGTAKAAKLAKVRQIEPLLVGHICRSPDDWRSRFDHRTAIAEHDMGFSRAEAERWAFECCVVEWLNANPSPSPAGLCIWCGQADMVGSVVLPFGSEPETHAWLHGACWPAWRQARRVAAVAALSSIGIQPRHEQNPLPTEAMSGEPEKCECQRSRPAGKKREPF